MIDVVHQISSIGRRIGRRTLEAGEARNGTRIAFDRSGERLIPDDVLAPALFEFSRGSRFRSV